MRMKDFEHWKGAWLRVFIELQGGKTKADERRDQECIYERLWGDTAKTRLRKVCSDRH